MENRKVIGVYHRLNDNEDKWIVRADTNADETMADAALLMKLLQKPEMAALLKTLAASL